MNIIELHILQSFPPTCLNRDRFGAPKSAMFGGRLIFTGCVHSQYGYAGTMTFTEATADASGELHFAPVPETGAAAVIDTTHAAL